MSLQKDTLRQLKQVRQASRKAHLIGDEQVRAVLTQLAQLAEARSDYILRENQKDLSRMPPDDPRYDRLKLTEARITDIASALRKVASLPSPLYKKLEEKTLSNGLRLEKVSVPLGVIGIIYESRPNVTFDVFALCLKSGNACVLKGGSDAAYSNLAIAGLIREVLQQYRLDEDMLYLLPTEREATYQLLQAVDEVDIIIPRGSQGLINFVRENARVPVIETGAGIVHTYLDQSADPEKAKNIVLNAKTRRVSVCNALDCLLVHQAFLPHLPDICLPLAEKEVEIFADEQSYQLLSAGYPNELLKKAEPAHFGTEFLSYRMSVRIVEGLEDALQHIARYSSMHSEAIVAEEETAIRTFMRSVDAAAVYANTSTAFTDGGQFGMGAEIGISTQKLHARGPMALPELTTYKWLIYGKGQLRNP
jgi:glutamate-5-semialdehyde dehydrogenase